MSDRMYKYTCAKCKRIYSYVPNNLGDPADRPLICAECFEKNTNMVVVTDDEEDDLG